MPNKAFAAERKKPRPLKSDVRCTEQMAIPARIPIRREEGYHTEKIGRFDGGQYIGFVFFLESGQRRLVSVLHRFDVSGNHVESEAWDEQPEVRLDEAIASLPSAEPGNVEVEPFLIELLGAQFGLIPREEQSYVVYLPYNLAFFPPWDGTYDT